MAEQTYTAKLMARILDVSLVRVGQLAKEEIITKLASGRYPLNAITQYIRFIRDDGRKKTKTDDAIEDEKLRKMRRENDIQEGLFAPVELMQDTLTRTGAQIVANLETLPLMMKREFPELTGDQITLVKKAIAECRNIIADMKIEIEYDGGVEDEE